MLEVGEHEGFFWENESWAFSNSDNSGESEEKFGNNKKLLDSSVAPNGQEEREKAIVAAPPATGKKRTGGNKNVKGKGTTDHQGINEGKGGDDAESDHETHIWTERERRKKMRNMFSSLHALLPQLPPKADKSTVVDEAVNYIKSLQHTLQTLQKQKLERLHGAPMITTQKLAAMEATREAFLADQGSTSNSTTTNPGNSVSIPRFPINFQTWTSPNLTLNVCGDDAHISVCCPKKPGLFSAICYVLEKHRLAVVSAQISSDHHRSMYMIQAHANEAREQLPEPFPLEEIYKQAAAEIIIWLSS